MLDLEDRLTRHYTDVASAPTLHRAPSMAPRLAFAGLIVALIAGAGYVSGFGSSGDDVVAGPGPDGVEANTIDPELLRLLERAAFEPDTTDLITYIDLDVARRGPTTDVAASDGSLHASPDALGLAPSHPFELLQAFRYPTAYEETFGFGVDDIERSLTVGSQGTFFSNTFIVISGDASTAVDRATAPTWATQDVRSQEGSFDIRDWGDTTTPPGGSSDVRPLGQTGQMTAFDGNVILTTVSRELLDPVLATDGDTPTLADQEQLLAALTELDFTDSVGFSAWIVPTGHLTNGENVDYSVPSLRLVQTSIDGSSRIVMGFVPGTDIDAAIAALRMALGNPIDNNGTMTTMQVDTINRSGDLAVIDLEPTAGEELYWINTGLLDVVGELFIANPGILS